MTTAADDDAVEGAFEAYLAGRPVPEGASGLVAFADEVRATATRPGRPNAALAELLATGLLIDQSSPSTRTAPTPGSSAAADARRRRRVPMFLSAFIAKIASAGAVAQAAAGAGIVVAAVAGAGAAGVLPEPLTATVSNVIGTDSATEETDGDAGTAEQTSAPTDSTDTATDDGAADGTEEVAEVTKAADGTADTGDVAGEPAGVTGAEETEAAYRNHGERVSEAARDDVPNREQMSRVAHENREAQREARASESSDEAEAEQVEVPEVEDDDEDEAPAAGRESNGGKGGKGGHGRG